MFTPMCIPCCVAPSSISTNVRESRCVRKGSVVVECPRVFVPRFFVWVPWCSATVLVGNEKDLHFVIIFSRKISRKIPQFVFVYGSRPSMRASAARNSFRWRNKWTAAPIWSSLPVASIPWSVPWDGASVLNSSRRPTAPRYMEYVITHLIMSRLLSSTSSVNLLEKLSKMESKNANKHLCCLFFLRRKESPSHLNHNNVNDPCILNTKKHFPSRKLFQHN